MRRFLAVVALVLALLGAIGAGSARSVAVRPAAAHMQLLAAGTPDTAVCGGSASTYCN